MSVLFHRFVISIPSPSLFLSLTRSIHFGSELTEPRGIQRFVKALCFMSVIGDAALGPIPQSLAMIDETGFFHTSSSLHQRTVMCVASENPFGCAVLC